MQSILCEGTNRDYDHGGAMSRFALFGLVVFLVGTSLSCSSGTKQPEAVCAAEGAPAITVKRIQGSNRLRIGDKTFQGWTDEFLLRTIRGGPGDQWDKIRGTSPATHRPTDISLKIYMARDSEYWFVGFDVYDHKRVAVPAQSPNPHRGDCLELFFAGKSPGSKHDIHDLLVQDESQAAFFQLQIPPFEYNDISNHFSDWRTDPVLKERALRNGFTLSSWTESDYGWRTEIKIPFMAFEPTVREAIKNGGILKFGFDYLDYDRQLANNTYDENYGFKPDNVFSFGRVEGQVNIPICMPTIKFE